MISMRYDPIIFNPGLLVDVRAHSGVHIFIHYAEARSRLYWVEVIKMGLDGGGGRCLADKIGRNWGNT